MSESPFSGRSEAQRAFLWRLQLAARFGVSPSAVRAQFSEFLSESELREVEEAASEARFREEF